MNTLKQLSSEKIEQIRTYTEDKLKNLYKFLLDEKIISEDHRLLDFKHVDINLNSFKVTGYSWSNFQIPILPNVGLNEINNLTYLINTFVENPEFGFFVSPQLSTSMLLFVDETLNLLLKDYKLINYMIEEICRDFIGEINVDDGIIANLEYLNKLISVTDKIYLTCENWDDNPGKSYEGFINFIDNEYIGLSTKNKINIHDNYILSSVEYIPLRDNNVRIDILN